MPFENNIHEMFNERYRTGETPWDTGISPPELLEAIENPPEGLPRSMLDIGCGTGTNCLTLARRGWYTVGTDFAPLAIDIANQKALGFADDIARANGSVRFLVADVTQLAPPALDERFSLLLDLGCLNGIPSALHANYAKVVEQQALPGALFLLYAHLPVAGRERPRAIGKGWAGAYVPRRSDCAASGGKMDQRTACRRRNEEERPEKAC